MICLSDNDVIAKLAACDLIEEAVAALGATTASVFVLPSARFVLLDPKHPEKAKARLGGGEVWERVRSFLERASVITVEPPAEEMQILDDLVGIDSGEAVLFSATAHFQDFSLATGDKRSLRTLASAPMCGSICLRLTGKVICFEQIILRVIGLAGFGHVRQRVVPGRHCDTALRAVFGSGLDSTERNVSEALTAYIAELRGQTGGVLVA